MRSRVFIGCHLPEDSICRFLIVSTELWGWVPRLQLAHPRANERRAISESDALRIEGCKKADGIAIYERYFSQIESHWICLFREEVVNHLYVHILKMAADVKQDQMIGFGKSYYFACHCPRLSGKLPVNTCTHKERTQRAILK